MSETAAETPAGARRQGWWAKLSGWVQRIPTGWFASILTGVFLAVAAAFGGLSPVAEAAVVPLQAGETQSGEQLSLTIERAVLLESFPEAGAYAQDGEQVIALLVSAENMWTEPFLSSTGSVEQALRLEGFGEVLDAAPPTSIARLDDATFGPWLQPGVQAELVVAWVVPDDSVQPGDRVSVTIRESKLERGSRLTSDARWASPAPVAVVELTAVAGGNDEETVEPAEPADAGEPADAAAADAEATP